MQTQPGFSLIMANQLNGYITLQMLVVSMVDI